MITAFFSNPTRGAREKGMAISPQRRTLLCVGLIVPVCVIIFSMMHFLTSSESDLSVSRQAAHTLKVVAPKEMELSLPVRVTATGKDFQWQFAYAGPDGTFGTQDDIPAGRVLHLPSGCPVELQLASRDYVYIMTLPMYGQREIAVPEMTHHLWFTPRDKMEADLPIDPMCGAGVLHKEAMGWLKVESPSQFRRWLTCQK